MCRNYVYLCFGALALTGCITPGSQPAKSQTLNVRDCEIYISGKPGENLLSQNQYLESNGTETYSPTSSPRLDASPTTKLSTSSGAGGVASLVGGAVSGIVSGLSSTDTTSGATTEDSSADAADCDDGVCAP